MVSSCGFATHFWPSRIGRIGVRRFAEVSFQKALGPNNSVLHNRIPLVSRYHYRVGHNMFAAVVAAVVVEVVLVQRLSTEPMDCLRENHLYETQRLGRRRSTRGPTVAMGPAALGQQCSERSGQDPYATVWLCFPQSSPGYAPFGVMTFAWS